MKKDRILYTQDELKKMAKNQTWFNQRMVEDFTKTLQNHNEDLSKIKRLADRECRACFYFRNRIAGYAMTDANCQHCDTIIRWNNTNAPKLCNNCCDVLKMCRRCFVELD
jgi:hypothetical protein